MNLEPGAPISDLTRLLRSLEPELHQGVYVFAVLPAGRELGSLPVVATFLEREGLTVVVEEGAAQQAGLSSLFRAAWITLTVHSDLEAVGLTAAFSGALADAGISCNVLAGAYHDHLFVPVARAQEALGLLRNLGRQ